MNCEAGQARSIRDDEVGAVGLSATLGWIEADASNRVSVADIARVAPVPARTLSGRFAEQLGTTSSAWPTRARVRRNLGLRETTDWDID